MEHERVAEQLRSIKPGVEEKPATAMPRQVLDFGIAYQEFVIDYCKRKESEED